MGKAFSAWKAKWTFFYSEHECSFRYQRHYSCSLMRLKNKDTQEGCKTRKGIGRTRRKFMDDYHGITSPKDKTSVKQTTANERTFCMENWAGD